MAKCGKNMVKSSIFVQTKHVNVLVYLALQSISTNNNTPSMPLSNAHSGGFFF